jgi:ADP-ribose pyrophosphatase YjhB (NUDIX family)
MKSVKSYSFEPKYRRDNGLVVLDTDKLPLAGDFEVRETSVVRLPAGQIAGNHKHSRREAYFCLDEGVQLHWVDEAGQVHIEQMANAENDPRLFVVPPFVPHAVVNASGRGVTLLGYADGPLENVEPVEAAFAVLEDSGELSAQEIVQATSLLSKLKPGFLPFDIFHAVTRLVATPIVEVVPLRLTAAGKVEVLLLQREANDPVWPGQWHVPGTVVRATDTPGSFDDALERVLSGELHNVLASRPVLVESIIHRQARGMEVSQVFWVEVQENSPVGAFHDIDNLPGTIVETQLDFIPDAIAHFKDTKS